MERFIEQFTNKVYHGTLQIHVNSLTKNIDLNKGNEFVDFGQGFYTTTNYSQALSFANIRAKRHNKFHEKKRSQQENWIPKYTKPAVLVYDIDKEHMKNLRGKVFQKANKEWAEFIFNNRMGNEFLVSSLHNINKEYDFIYGCLADAAIATLMEDIRLKKICYKDFCKGIEPFDKYEQNQLSIHSLKGLKCLELDDIIII
ncbi:MAG TPA: DUF3990 domain-containing protein [Epulopiscium sp.]|nr:DUF3990 domain-containing protein [Candidatus Epulonipiscium sp.]